MLFLSDAVGILVEGGLILLWGVLYFLWWIWKNKRISAGLKRAIVAEDTAAFDAALRKNFKTLCHKDNAAFTDVFAGLLDNNSLACARVLFVHADGPTWQKMYLEQASSSEGMLIDTIIYGTPEMLRLLLEQGVLPEADRSSPWLLAVSAGVPDKARVLDAFAPPPITPELQQDLDEHLLDEDAWECDPQSFVAVIDYLTEIRYPVPAAALHAAQQLKSIRD